MTAARTGKLAAVIVLTARGADVNARESWRGQTALMWAAAQGHLAVVQALIARGAEINAKSNTGYTPLMFAVRLGNIPVAEALVAAGAGVNDAEAGGVGVLAMAITNAHYELAALLLEKGANPNASTPGWTPLHLALMIRNPMRQPVPDPVPTGTLDSLGFIKALLAKGADPNARMTRRLRGDGRNDGHFDQIGATPLLLAAECADVPAMRLLLASGADPLAKTANNATALMAAAGTGYSQGKSPGTESQALEAVTLLVGLGNDVNAVDDEGFTAMHGAAIRAANSIVTFLFEKGARLDVRTREKQQLPLTLAEEGDGANSGIRAQPHTAALLRELMSKSQ
jgi:ankyrin repeat protein